MNLEPHTTSPTVLAIYEAYEARARQEQRRGYLGGSAIGKECSRALWYGFRWALRGIEEGRVQRLFETGQREELRVIENLRRIGVEVHELDPATKKQWRFPLLGGHFTNNLDAALVGLIEAPKTWHLLEIKTHKTKRFVAVKTKGVRVAQPDHFAQMTAYMGAAGLERAVYFAVCKETDELWIERVHFDRAYYETLLTRARQIITSPEPLAPYSHDPVAPPCGFCSYNALCYDDALPDVNCRTCAHSTPIVDLSEDAAWRCELTGEMLTRQAQERGCGEHLYIPGVVPHSAAIDSGDGYVLYQLRRSRKEWANVAGSAFPAIDVPHYSSREVRNMPADALGNEVVEKARELFGEVTDGERKPRDGEVAE